MSFKAQVTYYFKINGKVLETYVVYDRIEVRPGKILFILDDPKMETEIPIDRKIPVKIDVFSTTPKVNDDERAAYHEIINDTSLKYAAARRMVQRTIQKLVEVAYAADNLLWAIDHPADYTELQMSRLKGILHGMTSDAAIFYDTYQKEREQEVIKSKGQ